MTPFPPLRPGSVVRIVAPSGVVPESPFRAGLEILRQWGLRVRWSPRVLDQDGYLAGPDRERLREWREAFRDPEVEGVLTARGGYGAMRILPWLRTGADRGPPRLLMGFSDITALLVARLRQGSMGLHGSNVTTLGKLDPESLERTRAALFGDRFPETFHWEGLEPLRPGRAEGRLVAGNLSILCALLGTRFQPPMRGTVWLLEDVHEAAYRLDRMLTQLSLVRGMGALRGLVLGDLGLEAQEDLATLRRAILGLADRARCPVVAGFPAGHRGSLHPVPVGAMVHLDAQMGSLRVIEDPYLRG